MSSNQSSADSSNSSSEEISLEKLFDELRSFSKEMNLMRYEIISLNNEIKSLKQELLFSENNVKYLMNEIKMIKNAPDMKSIVIEALQSRKYYGAPVPGDEAMLEPTLTNSGNSVSHADYYRRSDSLNFFDW